MTLLDATATKREDADIAQAPDAAIGQALDAAFRQLAANGERFRFQFPGDHTRAGHYLPHVCDGFAAGANVGWTTGLWTGQMWIAHQLTGDPAFRSLAEEQVESFGRRLALGHDLATHDLGFLYTPSCVAAWHQTGSAVGRSAGLKAAHALLTRYLPNAGVIQAWGDLDDPAQRGRMIIDCLMNLPLLRWAGEQTGDSRYVQAADTHCVRARDHLVRADASTYHTFHFDPASGAPLKGTTHQGWADDSCWARGQAWGIYGFALNHRSAPTLGLLDTAARLGDYFLAHLPANGVAYWDLAFGEGSDEPWDSSASAIAVCGLLELADQLPAGAQSDRYRAAAHAILRGLIKTCAACLPASPALLLHGVYIKPQGVGVDEANLWGDYFYLEALARVASDWEPHWY